MIKDNLPNAYIFIHEIAYIGSPVYCIKHNLHWIGPMIEHVWI